MKTLPFQGAFSQAGGQGIEPRFFGPKPNVLPLDDPPFFLASRLTGGRSPTFKRASELNKSFYSIPSERRKQALLTVRRSAKLFLRGDYSINSAYNAKV